jgi:16S rRNA (guanine527-N7)-methyltransferase
LGEHPALPGREGASRFRERLEERAKAADLSLPTWAVPALESYFELLRRWNRRINLSALPLEHYSAAAIDRLIIEPLAAAHLVPGRPLTWFDIGSGGGSPAIPLRIVRPEARLIMVESRGRKAAFLREIARQLQLAGTEVLNQRLIDVSARYQGIADLITIRGVRIDPKFLQPMISLLGKDGLILLFGPSAPIPHNWPFRLVDEARLGSSSVARLFHVEQRGRESFS